MVLRDAHRAGGEDVGPTGHRHRSAVAAGGPAEGHQMPRSRQANPGHAKTQHRQRVRVVSAYFYPVLLDKCHEKHIALTCTCTGSNAESPISAKV